MRALRPLSPLRHPDESRGPDRITRAVFLYICLFILFIPNQSDAALFGPSNTKECIKEYLPKTQSDFAAALVNGACRTYFQEGQKKRASCILDLDELFEAKNNTAARVIFANSECAKIQSTTTKKISFPNWKAPNNLEAYSQAESAATCIGGAILQVNKIHRMYGQKEINCRPLVYNWYRSGLTFSDATLFRGELQDQKLLKQVYSTNDGKWEIEFCNEKYSKCTVFPYSEKHKQCTENWCSYCEVSPEKFEVDTCTIGINRKISKTRKGYPAVLDISISMDLDGYYFFNATVDVNGDLLRHSHENLKTSIAEKIYLDDTPVELLPFGSYDDPSFAPFLKRFRSSKKVTVCFNQENDCMTYPTEDFKFSAKRTGELLEKYLP